jgi:hypothetical protein
MIFNRPFKDAKALKGGVHNSTSRSIVQYNKKKIKFHYATTKFTLEIPEYKTLKITKRNAFRLAEWILTFKEK